MNMTNNSLFFVTSPLDQFEIRDLISIVMPILGNINLSITNMTLYLTISFIIIVALTLITIKSKKVIYNN
jgi:F-type H+-transporting ATPase subunit a